MAKKGFAINRGATSSRVSSCSIRTLEKKRHVRGFIVDPAAGPDEVLIKWMIKDYTLYPDELWGALAQAADEVGLDATPKVTPIFRVWADTLGSPPPMRFTFGSSGQVYQTCVRKLVPGDILKRDLGAWFHFCEQCVTDWSVGSTGLSQKPFWIIREGDLMLDDPRYQEALADPKVATGWIREHYAIQPYGNGRGDLLCVTHTETFFKSRRQVTYSLVWPTPDSDHQFTDKASLQNPHKLDLLVRTHGAGILGEWLGHEHREFLHALNDIEAAVQLLRSKTQVMVVSIQGNPSMVRLSEKDDYHGAVDPVNLSSIGVGPLYYRVFMEKHGAEFARRIAEKPAFRRVEKYPLCEKPGQDDTMILLNKWSGESSRWGEVDLLKQALTIPLSQPFDGGIAENHKVQAVLVDGDAASHTRGGDIIFSNLPLGAEKKLIILVGGRSYTSVNTWVYGIKVTNTAQGLVFEPYNNGNKYHVLQYNEVVAEL